MDKKTIRELARIGAQARLATLEQERRTIAKLFPELRTAPYRPAEPAPRTAKPAKKLHWTQTAAGKRKMARVQKAAWARRRANEAGE